MKYLDAPVPARRHEKRKPGELVHLDVEKLGRIRGIGHRITGFQAGLHRSRGVGWEFVHVCVDDYNRVAYVEILPDEKGPTAVAFLKNAAEWFGQFGIRIRRVMTDNGSCYVSKPFAIALADLRAKHLRTRPYTPSASSKRVCGNGPTPAARTPARHAGAPCWCPGFAGTTSGAHGGIGGAPPISRLQEAA